MALSAGEEVGGSLAAMALPGLLRSTLCWFGWPSEGYLCYCGLKPPGLRFLKSIAMLRLAGRWFEPIRWIPWLSILSLGRLFIFKRVEFFLEKSYQVNLVKL